MPHKLQYNVRIRLPNESSVFVGTPVKTAHHVMSSGRVFQSLGPATANERSPTITSRDRGMISSEEVDDRRRRRDVMSETNYVHNLLRRSLPWLGAWDPIITLFSVMAPCIIVRYVNVVTLWARDRRCVAHKH